MRKSYIMIYSNALGSRDEIKECVDSLEQVIHWRFDMPNSFYLVSEENASTLAKAIREYLEKDERFLITEYMADNAQGWLPKKTWSLLKEKKRD